MLLNYIINLLVLVGGYGNELGLSEDVGPEGGVGQLEDVAGPHQVEPGLVLVHRVQNCLKIGFLIFTQISSTFYYFTE